MIFSAVMTSTPLLLERPSRGTNTPKRRRRLLSDVLSTPARYLLLILGIIVSIIFKVELPRCIGWEPFIVRQKWQRMYIQYRTDRINVEKNWCSWMVEATVCVVVLSLNRIAPISMIRNVYFNFNIFSIFENIG